MVSLRNIQPKLVPLINLQPKLVPLKNLQPKLVLTNLQPKFVRLRNVQPRKSKLAPLNSYLPPKPNKPFNNYKSKSNLVKE